MTRVFIVGESARSRERLEDLLDARRIEVVGSASNLESASEALAEEDADVLLVDAANGFVEELLEMLSATEVTKETAVVVLLDQSAPVWAAQAVQAGVRGVLSNDADAEQLAAALEAAAAAAPMAIVKIRRRCRGKDIFQLSLSTSLRYSFFANI